MALLGLAAITAGLVIILVPVLNDVKEQDQHAVCATNAGGIGLAILLYAKDNIAMLPLGLMNLDVDRRSLSCCWMVRDNPASGS